MTIYSTELTSEKYQWIADIFEKYNEKQGFTQKHENFCFEYREADSILGIIHGKYFGGWCAITDIAVSEHARGKGVGKALMSHVEAEAKQKDCVGIHLTTLSFQAPEFYKKLGFDIYAELDQFAGGKRILLKKQLK